MHTLHVKSASSFFGFKVLLLALHFFLFQCKSRFSFKRNISHLDQDGKGTALC